MGFAGQGLCQEDCRLTPAQTCCAKADREVVQNRRAAAGAAIAISSFGCS